MKEYYLLDNSIVIGHFAFKYLSAHPNSRSNLKYGRKIVAVLKIKMKEDMGGYSRLNKIVDQCLSPFCMYRVKHGVDVILS